MHTINLIETNNWNEIASTNKSTNYFYLIEYIFLRIIRSAVYAEIQVIDGNWTRLNRVDRNRYTFFSILQSVHTMAFIDEVPRTWCMGPHSVPATYQKPVLFSAHELVRPSSRDNFFVYYPRAPPIWLDGAAPFPDLVQSFARARTGGVPTYRIRLP